MLILIKFGVGIISGSVSILSEAIHSTTDLIAAIIAYYSVKVSSIPPDKNHPYGHGKFENVSGVVEGLLILVAAVWIIAEAIKKFFNPEPMDYLFLGVGVMGISAIVNIIVSKKLYRVAKETDSIALEADALHLKMDVYTSAGVATGLLLIWITEMHILDPFIAIIVALLILYESFVLLKKAFNPLLDTRLPEADIKKIEGILCNYQKSCISYHQFRTRKSGSYKYLDFHLEVPETMSVGEAHKLCDRIENDLRKQIKNLDVNIHVEPCSEK
ncbi:MAG: cation transporter [Bacteroidales bacterium]|nr:cation transporter [Bacteroidales bacterium]